MSLKVAFLGNHKSGKSALLHRCVTKVYNENIPSDISGVLYFSAYKKEEQVKLNMWEIADNASTKDVFLKDCSVCVYTIDLSTSFDNKEQERIKQDLNKIRETAPTAQLILVGTKSDSSTIKIEETKAILDSFCKTYGIHNASGFSYLMTSAKKDEGTQLLLDYIIKCGRHHYQQCCKLALDKAINSIDPHAPMHEAIEKFNKSINALSPAQQGVMQQELEKLITGLQSAQHNQEETFKLINLFINATHAIEEASRSYIPNNLIEKIREEKIVLITASLIAVLACAFGLGLGPSLLAFLATERTGIALQRAQPQRFFSSFVPNNQCNFPNTETDLENHRSLVAAN